MPNLVGIGNSQVPTNAMLGGLAYQDSVGEINIEKIKARTSDTALGVFVYDTRKDSDGGAWRYRTQNTSWYDEVVSAERGARREFPSVAVIVVTSTLIIIYDGDDPNLPMWMVLNETSTNGSMLYSSSSSDFSGAVSALNGNIYYGMTGNGTLGIIEFVRDGSFKHRRNNRSNRGRFLGRIADRRLALGFSKDNDIRLAGEAVSDIATTVLPNAPIETSTGLPIPTIAAATDGGTSIIKDNGTIVDIVYSGSPNTAYVDFRKSDNAIVMSMNSNGSYVHVIYDIPTSDISGSHQYQKEGIDDEFYRTGSSQDWNQEVWIYSASPHGGTTVRIADNVISGNGGINVLAPNKNAIATDTMVARIASSFNSGYMHGDIKGAFLSSIDDTNLSGTSLIANGDFSSNSTAAFTTVAGGTAAVVGGLLKLTDTGGAFCYASAPFTTVVGNQYFVTVDIVNNSNTAPSNYIRCGNSHNGTEFHNTNYGTGYGTKTFYFTATATTTYLTLISGHGAGNPFGHWDNVFVYKLDNDRSVNSKGLQPYGTINKNPVATGAELVAYSNFNNSRYLFQPYNSDLNFTTTMSIMFWVNGWVGSDSLLHRGPGTTRNSKTSFHLYCSYDYNYRITFTTNGSTEQSFEFNHTANLPGWQCVCFTLSGGTVRGFRNGVEQTLNQTSFSGNIFSQATDKNGLWIGTGPVGGAADTASLALLRLSASAPSAEQVKKIYDDEKCLFHENAKCTLHGTSNNVKALAFDDTNNILHVGTSSGRSEFQGLNRINNTTTAVTTAISASNGFVAEQ